MRFVLGEPAPPSTPTLAVSAVGLVLLLAARFFPFHTMPPTCGLRLFLHVPCPTCGMTRAFVHTTHGAFASAFRVSPLGTLLALGAAGLAGYVVLRFTVWKRRPITAFTRKESLAIRIGIGAVILANWAYLILSGAAA